MSSHLIIEGIESKSPILAEIYINHLENRILRERKFSTKSRHCTRYVDDILILWAGTSRQVDHFLTRTNSMNDNIKFTVEKKNTTVSYLDLALKLEGNQVEYQIYWKLIHSDITIPKKSCHHPKHKKAALQNYCDRALFVLKNEDERRKEMNDNIKFAVEKGKPTIR
jgi:hypothetical protein